jgi:hypothetical protein
MSQETRKPTNECSCAIAVPTVKSEGGGDVEVGSGHVARLLIVEEGGGGTAMYTYFVSKRQ